MAILGKILGGAAGFALGGPLGALVGAAAGHAIDRIRDGERPSDDERRQSAFAVAVIVLGAKMAKADGRVTRDEIAAFRQAFPIPDEQLKDVGRIFDAARGDARGFEPYARQVADMFAGRPAVLEELLDALLHIAKADGVVHPAEEEFLRDVAGIFGLDDHDFARVRASHLGPDDADPYAVLGVRPDAGDDEVRSAWRRLTKENHPDKLIADGMPQEFVDVATARMAAINSAYEEIRARRA